LQALGASPASIRAALLPEDKATFDEAYAEAVDQAKRDDALAALHGTVKGWRRRAIAQSAPEAFSLMVRRAAEFYCGDPIPADEPFTVTRAKAGT
jgi:hypothetical protein